MCDKDNAFVAAIIGVIEPTTLCRDDIVHYALVYVHFRSVENASYTHNHARECGTRRFRQALQFTEDQVAQIDAAYILIYR